MVSYLNLILEPDLGPSFLLGPSLLLEPSLKLTKQIPQLDKTHNQNRYFETDWAPIWLRPNHLICNPNANPFHDG